MTVIDRSALLSHSAEELYDLVADIERYPEFLPGCVAADVLASEVHAVTARLTLSRAGITQAFTTRNTLVPGASMELTLVDGPFEHFAGRWTFKALAPQACKVALQLEFQLGGGLINAAAGKLFDRVAHDLVDAVVRRAGQVCGSGTS